MKIIVDVMGGDKAPEETVKGAIAAYRELAASDISFVWVGNRADIARIAEDESFDMSQVELVHTETVITMEDNPMVVTRAKQDSSMSVGLRLLADGKGDAFVSTGNTGALFTGATLIVRKVKGIQRAGIGTVLPCVNPVLLMDSGANVTVTEENLEQFGVIGSAYMRKMFGIKLPRVGLLNNGTEEHKGTELQQAAYRRLQENGDLNFVGNIEGSALPFDHCDVVVTDGFTGNILLKSMEGVGKMILGKIKGVFYTNALTKLAALLVKPHVKQMKKELDPNERGGAPILGISKPVIKAHGSSDAKAFKNAIRQAAEYATSGAIEEIATAAEAYAARKKAARNAKGEQSAQSAQ
ncbi:MAG: phosphate acyltransferase PlsX [Ruminococcaceae bacterium]|nr:phosphate acyltransferase PlsX [Oscillospiraceae bacterium]